MGKLGLVTSTFESTLPSTPLFITLPFQIKTEQQKAPPTEEEQLLAALKTKADAFANKDWEAYWMREGPMLLTNGWLVAHPDIPLAKVEEVCSLDFISSAVESLSLKEHQGHNSYIDESIISGSAGDKGTKTTTEGQEMDLSSGHDHATVIAELVTGRESTSTTTVLSSPSIEGQAAAVMYEDMDGEGSTVFAPSNEEIFTMWNEHYNAYYWYMYQMFVAEQSQELVGEGEGEVEVKEGGVEEREQNEAVEPNHEEVSFSVLE